MKLALIQTAIFGIVFGIWFYFSTRAYLAAPSDGDLYAHTWSFQALNVCVFYLPPCIAALTMLLLIERVALRRWGKKQIDHETQSLA